MKVQALLLTFSHQVGLQDSRLSQVSFVNFPVPKDAGSAFIVIKHRQIRIIEDFMFESNNFYLIINTFKKR